MREVKRQNKNGTQASYLQLVHNQWDPAARASRTKILYSFGRTDQVERAAIERLIASLSRLLDPATAFTATAGSELTFLEARPLGGTHVLDGMWHRLGIDKVMGKLLEGRRLDPRVERVLFALVANRALDASSKLAAAGWVEGDVHIDGLPATSDDACYRAMDWLLEIAHDLERAVFWQVATLLDLEVDLLFFDTTSTYFELDEPDAPIARDRRGMPVPQPDGDAGDGHGAGDATKAGFRSYGKSKDHRDDLPQVVVGMAVTGCCASTRLGSRPRPTSTASTCCAPATPPAGRRHRAGLQAATGGQTGLARPQAGHRPAPGLPPAGGAHPRPRRAVLARAAAGPDRRNHHRRHLAVPRGRAEPPAGNHLHRPGRDLSPAHRADQAPA